MIEALKPCPFCGGKASSKGVVRHSTLKKPNAWWDDGSPVEDAYFCNCTICNANNQGIVGGYQTEEKAIEAWNTRAPYPLVLLKKCKTLLEILDNGDKHGVVPYYQAELDALLSDIAKAEARNDAN